MCACTLSLSPPVTGHSSAQSAPPGTSQPSTGRPGISQPGQLITGQPGTVLAGTRQPVTGQPVTSQPVTRYRATSHWSSDTRHQSLGTSHPGTGHYAGLPAYHTGYQSPGNRAYHTGYQSPGNRAYHTGYQSPGNQAPVNLPGKGHQTTAIGLNTGCQLY